MTAKGVPRISILVAVDDELLDPRAWYLALNNQTLPASDYEVLVLDSSHFTGHQSAFNQFRDEGLLGSHISFHRTKRGGRALALNQGIELAGSNVIVFLGDDCLVPLNFAEAHLRFHEQNPAKESVAIGCALVPEEFRTHSVEWLEESGRQWGVPHRADMVTVPPEFFYAANASVKRELLELAGRWDERFPHHAWDDFEYGERLRAVGMRAEFLPDAPVQHIHRVDLPDREKSMRLAGVAARVYETIHPGGHRRSRSLKRGERAHELRIALAQIRSRITRSDRAMQKWWKCRLDAAFAEGYRQSATENKI